MSNTLFDRNSKRDADRVERSSGLNKAGLFQRHLATDYNIKLRSSDVDLRLTEVQKLIDKLSANNKPAKPNI